MQITLPDDPLFQATAAAGGYASVEEYVLAVLQRETRRDIPREVSDNDQPLSHDRWKQEFDAFRRNLRPCNPNVDDSRESIYPVRD